MIELLTTAQMARADRLAISGGTSGMALMEAAGRAVADAARAMLPPRGLAAIVCGPGNNGGDGFVAARLLAAHGHPVRVLLAGERAGLRDAAEAARRWDGEIAAAAPARLEGAALIVDALFGAGLARPVEGPQAALIGAMNRIGVPILAVDLPSGVNGDSGAVMGIAVRAGETVTFFRRKPGHLLLPGRLYCGRIRVADIGIPASVLNEIAPQTFANEPPLWASRFPIPAAAGHKYTRGHAVVLSGGIASTGAARLAARGALRAGAGLVTIAAPRESLAVNAAAATAVMVRPVDGVAELADLLEDRRLTALVLGPGGGVGPAMREAVKVALGSDRAVVLDADALTSFANHPASLFAMIAARPAAPTVLTPHEGEFARLFNSFIEMNDVDGKSEKLIQAMRLLRAVIVLKGGDTTVASPDGCIAIAANAPPWLATAGSGDVLAGMIAGLLAQRMPAFEAASAAVWLHGEAALEAGPGLISEDLPEILPRVLKKAAGIGWF